MLTTTINTPSPYYLLSKNTNRGTVHSISSSKEVFDDIKTLTAHRCNTISSITYLDVENKSCEVPRELLVIDRSSSIIKTGKLTPSAIDIIHQCVINVKETLHRLVINFTNVDSRLFQDVIEKLTPRASIVVIDVDKCHLLLERSSRAANLNDILKMASDFSCTVDCMNILVTGFLDSNGSFVDVLFNSYNRNFTLFISEFKPINSDNVVTAAIAANLSNNYKLVESVYAALEYTQTSSVISASSLIVNQMHNIDIPMAKMIEDQTFSAGHLVTSPELINNPSITTDFFEYLIRHPLVKPHWDSYIHHDFVRQVADGTLPLKNFQFYIEQDYNYLVDYGRVHCIAASKSPDIQNMESELYVIGRIRNSMNHHKKRIREVFCIEDPEHMDKVKRSPELNEYSRYFKDIAEKGTWAELVAALSPCIMGYGTACFPYRNGIKAPAGSIYDEWINFYSTDTVDISMAKGRFFLNTIAKTLAAKDLNRIVQIYADVCELEAKFWTSALNYN